jgi:hypothetical protein
VLYRDTRTDALIQADESNSISIAVPIMAVVVVQPRDVITHIPPSVVTHHATTLTTFVAVSVRKIYLHPRFVTPLPS